MVWVAMCLLCVVDVWCVSCFVCDVVRVMYICMCVCVCVV